MLEGVLQFREVIRMQTEEAPPTEALLDGRYRLLNCVGRGGMASVYRADDLLLGRTVAVKLIRHDPEARFSADRAESEKALLASLSHPSLVTLFDARLEPGSAQYLVMEFVDGPTLTARLTYGPVPSAQVAQIAGDLADALDTVHGAGIIHRDVKPSNVLLTPPRTDTGAWGAKLADFGIACAPADVRMTSPGLILGTAAYMAPEQLRNGDLGTAVDIYALGLVLLEALTGEPAYPVGSSLESALVRLSVPPTIPESLGSGWTGLLERMTRMDPAERPTAAEVAAAVRSIPPPDGVQAQPSRDAESAAVAMAAEPEALPPTQVLAAGAAQTGALTTGAAQTGALPTGAAQTGRRRPLGRSVLAVLAAVGLAATVLLAGFWFAGSAAPENASRMAGVISTQRTSPAQTVDDPAPAEPEVVTIPADDRGPDDAEKGDGGKDGEGAQDKEKPGRSEDDPGKGGSGNSGSGNSGKGGGKEG